MEQIPFWRPQPCLLIPKESISWFCIHTWFWILTRGKNFILGGFLAQKRLRSDPNPNFKHINWQQNAPVANSHKRLLILCAGILIANFPIEWSNYQDPCPRKSRHVIEGMFWCVKAPSDVKIDKLAADSRANARFELLCVMTFLWSTTMQGHKTTYHSLANKIFCHFAWRKNVNNEMQISERRWTFSWACRLPNLENESILVSGTVSVHGSRCTMILPWFTFKQKPTSKKTKSTNTNNAHTTQCCLFSSERLASRNLILCETYEKCARRSCRSKSRPQSDKIPSIRCFFFMFFSLLCSWAYVSCHVWT